MVVGLGTNKSTGRQVILITLNEDDIVKLIREGIELSQDAHSGFPATLEVAIYCAEDEQAARVARDHNPDADFIEG